MRSIFVCIFHTRCSLQSLTDIYTKSSSVQHNQYFFAFFKAFQYKKPENEDFDQRLECKAPKRWLKYTTDLSKKSRENKALQIIALY